MKHPPLVSVIIPVYNCERYLKDAIDSVLNQTYRPLDLIVVDDGSTDESAAIAQSYKEIRYLYQKNQGPAIARNVGIDSAKGEFISFLDADDQWTPDKLSLQIEHHQRHPQLAYTITNQRICLEAGCQIPSTFKTELLLKSHPGYVPSTLVIRQDVFMRIGNFDPEHVPAEDMDWFIRAKDAGMAMAILPQTLLNRRIHNKNITLQSRLVFSQQLNILKKSIERKKNVNKGIYSS